MAAQDFRKMRLRPFAMFVVSAALVSGLGISAASAHKLSPHRAKRLHVPRVERDCTPINGFYGYYGNPWCDTGSYRPPDIEFRERQRFLRRQAGRVRR
jgi:hypothetical protein